MFNEKQKIRAAELLSQLKGDDYEERDIKVRNFAERGKELTLNSSRNQDLGRGQRTRKAPWETNSDSESGDDKPDKACLSRDGKEVIQKEYKFINGHWALLTYRRQLNEVDPGLLVKLRENREKQQAKRKARQEERKAKGIEREQLPLISTPPAQLTGMGSPRPTTPRTPRKERGRKSEHFENHRQPSKHAMTDAEQQEVSQWRQISKTETKETHPQEGEPSLSLPSSPSSLSHISSSSTASPSPKSFKARAKAIGFRPIERFDSQADIDIWERIADGEEDIDIWQKIAYE
ncbi:hypothetical protein F5Y09DRAFT_351611 [Xylaria sp. FL1042]|nr:hypothetical protein F5Y09DRAFT_351611 [Xylaria sp. FL1042]